MRSSLRRITLCVTILIALCALTSGEGLHRRVIAQELTPDGNARILVTDTGIQIDAELYSRVQNGDSAPFIIYMRETADLTAAYDMDWVDRGRYVYETLNAQAVADQRDLLQYLTNEKVTHTSFWINNSVYVQGMDSSTFNALLSYDQISSIEPQHIAYIPEPYESDISVSATAVQSNLVQLDAQEVWAQGIDGNGITVASIDTGVRYTHRTLEEQYRGTVSSGVYDHDYSWYDPTGTSPTVPLDNQGHGTHTVGVMVGSDDSDIIGMATGAEWIACKGCTGTSCSETDLLACAQFTLAPTTTSGLAPNPDLRPNIVNNSWGDGDGLVKQYDDWFQSAVDSWQAAGIYPIFSAGNSRTSLPPDCSTVGNPARYGNVTAVGATGTSDGAYANYSLRGPSDQADATNSLDDPYIKPQVVAPGTSIVSASYENDLLFRTLSGTSMAAPHVAGLVALMWQAAPCLIGNYATTENILEQTANPVYSGLPSSCPSDPADLLPNNSTGWGEVDAYAAVAAARDYCGDSTLQGKVTDATTGAPIAQATIRANSNSRTVSTKTSSDGTYTLALWPDSYDLSVSAYGYRSALSDISLSAGITETLDFQLTPEETHTLSGQVVDADTGWPLYALVAYTISGSGAELYADTLWTDSVNGTFSLEIPENTVCSLVIKAYTTGYRVYNSSINAPSQDTNNTFGLYPCAECTAPGASLMASVETFGDLDLPTAWQNIDNAGGAVNWLFDNPSGRTNETGGTGGFAMVDSDLAGQTNVDTELRSPFFNMSGTSVVTLAFKQSFRHLGEEIADIDVSVDGGTSWVNVYRLQEQNALGPNAQEINISAVAANQPLVMVRFHYHGAFDDWYWQIDDVHVFAGESACQRSEGGLVVGQVYAVTTEDPLSLANVTNQCGYAAISASTADLETDDGYYVLFSPAGENTISASAPYYDTSSTTVDVTSGDTREVNLVLSAPRSIITATSYAAVLTESQQISWPLRIANSGTAPLEYQILEQDLGTESISHDTIIGERKHEPLSAEVQTAIETAQSDMTDEQLTQISDTGTVWETMAPLPEERTRPAVAAVGHYVYVIGGSNSLGEQTNSVFRYDTNNDSWSELAPAPSPLDGADTAVIAGYVYIPGDADSGTTYVLDTYQGVWTTITANGDYGPRWEYAAVPHGHRVYVLGGLAGGVVSNQVWVLDTITATWTQSSSMMAARLGAMAGWTNDELIIAGGMTGTASELNPLLTCEVWNGSYWSYGPSLPGDGDSITRWSYAADATGAEGLWIAGGPRDESLGQANSLGQYSAITQTWTCSPSLPSMGQQRGYLEGAIATDGYFYAIGGQSADGSTVFDTVERYEAAPLSTQVDWLTVTPVSGTVDAGTEALLNLTLDAAQTASLGTYHASVVIDSNDPLQPQIWIPITLTVSATPGTMSFECADTSDAGGHPGEYAFHSISVKNTGATTDYYTADISEGGMWLPSVPTLIGPVAPGETIQAFVQVKVPSTADWPDSDTSVVTIHSALVPTSTHPVTLNTRAYPPRMQIALIYN